MQVGGGGRGGRVHVGDSGGRRFVGGGWFRVGPDLNPIEQLFARLKSFLRKMKARTVEELWRAIASFLKGVSKGECKAYLANSGYT